MASTRKFEMEVNLKSPVETVWNAIKDMHLIYPTIFPDIYESFKILEGDGKSAGTIRLVTYAEGCTVGIGRDYKSKIVSVDEENKSVLYSVVEGTIKDLYKMFDDTITVRANGEGSVVVWSLTYEQAIKEAPEGVMYKDAMAGVFQKLDAYLLANNKN